jgi:hypothetical protein
MRVLKMGLVLVLWVLAFSAHAELTFPALSGRVVDEAQMLEPSVRAQLSQQLHAAGSARHNHRGLRRSARSTLGHRSEGQEQRRAADRCP